MNLRRRSPALLRGVFVDGVERNLPVPEPLDCLVEQCARTHRVEYQPASVVGEFFEYGNRACIVPDFGVGVRYHRAVEIHGDQCIVYSHIISLLYVRVC